MLQFKLMVLLLLFTVLFLSGLFPVGRRVSRSDGAFELAAQKQVRSQGLPWSFVWRARTCYLHLQLLHQCWVLLEQKVELEGLDLVRLQHLHEIIIKELGKVRHDLLLDVIIRHLLRVSLHQIPNRAFV